MTQIRTRLRSKRNGMWHQLRLHVLSIIYLGPSVMAYPCIRTFNENEIRPHFGLKNLCVVCDQLLTTVDRSWTSDGRLSLISHKELDVHKVSGYFFLKNDIYYNGLR